MKNKEDIVNVDEKPIIVRRRIVRKKIWFFKGMPSLKDLMLMVVAFIVAIWIFAFVLPVLIILGSAYFVYRYLKRKRWFG